MSVKYDPILNKMRTVDDVGDVEHVVERVVEETFADVTDEEIDNLFNS